jgi:tRNA-binding EMAP/Myf-like protein
MYVVVGLSFDIGGKILVIMGAKNRLENDDVIGALKLYVLGFMFILVSLGASEALTLNMSADNRSEQIKKSDNEKKP